MEITLYNIREKIFLNLDLQKKLSFFKNIFDEWNFSRSIGGMASRMKHLEMELLNSLDENHISILNQYFLSNVKIKKIENNLSKNYQISIEEDKNLPEDIQEYKGFCISSNEKKIYLTLWR